MKRTNRVLSAMLAAAMVLSAGVQGVKADGAKWTETETADGWMLVTNEGGKTLGYSKTKWKTMWNCENNQDVGLEAATH